MRESINPETSADIINITPYSRFLATWWGAWIGDALAMPAHWYYKRDELFRDYGHITEYQRPKNPHPGSILWRSRYESTGEKDNILHDQAQYWGKPGIHYHQHLSKGENTLNLKLSTLLTQSLIERKGYDQSDYSERYINFMLDPDSHRDTYVEEAHRAFFNHYAKGKKIEKCGIEDTHIGALSTLMPLILFYHKDLETLLVKVSEHLSLTHKGATTAKAGQLYAEIIHYSLQGHSMEEVLFSKIGRRHYQTLGAPYHRWIANHEDEEVIGKIVSTACYMEDALPATVYLALKYNTDFEKGLVQNVNLGGDNCHRGTVLGAILGAQNGCEGIPQQWVQGLADHTRYDQLADQLWAATQ